MAAPRHALLLTAGLGTRLRPLTLVRAKPAIPVGGEPIVRRIVSWLASNGVTDVVANLHHLPATVTGVLGDGADLGARVRYSWEQPVVLGSAGGPRQALDIIGADTFLIVNGDTLADVNLEALAAAHAASGALVTLALVPNREPQRYGGVQVDDRGHVTGFVVRGAAAASSLHFIGVQIASASAFRTLAAGRRVESIRGLYDELVTARPGSVCGFVSEATFWDVGTVSDYVTTSRAFSGADRSSIGRAVRIDPSARVHDSILWDDIDVGPGCDLESCIVTDRVRLAAGARYRRAILMDGGGATLSAPLPD